MSTKDCTSPLKVCPFCGGEADMVDEGSECSPDRFWACCPNPSCFVEGTGVYATEEEAAQAWNTRVERTCHDDGREGGERMSDKKYLLTESDIRQIKDLECGWCADNAGGHFNCAEASKAEQERFLEAHEYRERTCKMKDERWDDGQCTWGVICSACGDKHEHGDSIKYCPKCGCRVMSNDE